MNYKVSAGYHDEDQVLAYQLKRSGKLSMSGKERDNDFGTSDDILVKPREKTKKPSMYKVLLLNDDYTPMEFVIHILTQFFGKDQDAATQIMLQVHQKGVGICGVYSYDVAETKATQVVDFARKNQHPLQCIVEKE